MSRNPDIAQAHPQSIAIEQGRWDELDRLINREHPRYGEYARVAEEARSLLSRMLMSTNMPGGWPMIQRGWEKVLELYQRAVTIRGSMVHDGLHATSGTTPGGSIEASCNRTFDAMESNPLFRANGVDLKKIAVALDVNPSELLSKSTVPGNLFFMKVGNSYGVNFSQINWARQKLTDVENAPGLVETVPGLREVIQRLRAGVNQIANTDPVRSVRNDLENAPNKQPLATMMPLRVIGALGGALVSGIGLVYVLTGNKEFTWPIFAWAGMGYYCMNPDILKGRSYHDLQRIAQYGTPSAHKLMAEGFRGNDASKAIGELQDIRQRNGGLLRRMQKSEVPLSMAQIALECTACVRRRDESGRARVRGRVPQNCGSATAAGLNIRLLS
jgi:hypothetical protein